MNFGLHRANGRSAMLECHCGFVLGGSDAKRSGEDAGRKWLGDGPELGLAQCASGPEGTARGGQAYSVELRDVESSLGAAVNLKLDA